ncbi:MAG: hypothetical protein R6V31_08465 [Halohasta sp.]
MDIDEEMRRQTVVSLFAVGLFLASLIGIGVVFDGAEGLPSDGALALVAALAGFVLLMAAVGLFLIRSDDPADS